MVDMKRYLRKVAKRSNTKFEYTLSVPAFFVRELGLNDNIVELKIKDGYFTVKKIGNTLENSSIEDEENKDYTIHY